MQRPPGAVGACPDIATQSQGGVCVGFVVGAGVGLRVGEGDGGIVGGNVGDREYGARAVTTETINFAGKHISETQIRDAEGKTQTEDADANEEGEQKRLCGGFAERNYTQRFFTFEEFL